jgi:F-type H+-transporting ATPase subunit b
MRLEESLSFQRGCQMLRKFFAINALLMGMAAIPLQAAEAAGAEPKGELLDLNVVGGLWVLGIFIVLAIFLYKTAWKNVLAGLKAREKRIRDDIAQAESLRLKAEQTLRDYNAQLAGTADKAREVLAKAAADAERLAAQIRTHAQQEAEESKERALRDIEAARTQAVADIYQQAAQLATSVAEKILRRNLNPDDQRDLVNQSIEQFSKVGKN